MFKNRKRKIKLEIQALNDRGEGLAQYQDRNLTIPYALSGEVFEIESEIENLKLNLKRNDLITLIKKSKDRVDPACAHFGVCGGCQLQHLNYEAQLAQKELWLKQVISPFIALEKILPITPSPQVYGYRRRAQFHVNPQGQIGYLGYHSHRVLPIYQCPILEAELELALPEIQEKASELFESQKRPTFLKLEATLEQGKVKIQEAHEERAFIQNNRFANEKLIEFIKYKLLEDKEKSILELYAGDGNLTLPLAPLALRYCAVENNPQAVELGKKKAEELALKVEWRRAEAAKFLQNLPKDISFDWLIADPPRQGLGDALEPILQLKIPNFIYVSCSLPRLPIDLKKLSEAYEVLWVKPFDFFPQTTHLETVVGLRLR